MENPSYQIGSKTVVDGYSGSLGCNFQVAAADVPSGDSVYITALGYYAGTNSTEFTGGGTVTTGQTLSLWGPSTSAAANLGSENVTNVTLAAGTAVDSNGFAWVTLNPPLPLVAGDYYDLLTTENGSEVYLQPVDSANNTPMVLPAGSPFVIYKGAYSTSGYAYSGSTYLGPNMQYEIEGPTSFFPVQALYATPPTFSAKSYSGAVGCKFTTGSTNVLVSHLGYFSTNAINGLATNHYVAVFTGTAANPQILEQAVVPSGTSAYYTNGFYWVQLNPPLLLNSNTTYFVAAQTYTGDGDTIGNFYTATWNSTFVGGTLATTNEPQKVYGPGTVVWPPTQFTVSSPDSTYLAENMAFIPVGPALAGVATTNAVFYAGNTISVQGFSSGQQPVTNQWWEVGSPNVLISTSTNAFAALSIPNATAANSGVYFMTSSNALGGDQSSDVTITVIPDGPSFTQNIQPQSQTTFDDQTAQFAVAAEGVAPLGYQWYFDGTPIAGATNNTLTLADVSSNNIGTYYVIVTNSYGSATSANASLTVNYPAPGTYPSVVMGPNLLLYYPLNDYNGGGSAATNWGSLGFAYNGAYVGGCSSVPGPANVNFGNDDNAVYLDGYSGYVELPPLTNSAGAPGVIVSNITIAAWVYDEDAPQVANAAIFFQRSTSVFGLSVNPDPNTGADALTYTWNGTGFANITGLDLPSSQWALAAMVITPTNSAVYLQYGSVLQSTNFAASNPSATFSGNSFIGWDSAGGSGGRLWTGPIGDVMVFNQALSPTAINSLYTGILPSVTLTISPVANNQLTVKWSGGTLLQATNVVGPWTVVPGAANGVYTTNPSNNAEFYRVQE